MADPSPLPRTVRGVLGAQPSEDLVTWLDSTHVDMRAGMRADLAEMERRLLDQMGAMEERLRGQIHAVDVRVAESKAELMRWSLVFWVGAVGAIAALAGMLRAG